MAQTPKTQSFQAQTGAADQPCPSTLYLIDGHAQIFRAYFAIRGGMSSPLTGEPTHAVFAYAGMLLKLFLQFQPQFLAMAIDMPGKTFRDDLYPLYKANREKAPDDFLIQERRIIELTRLFGIPILGVPGAEADDVIATLATRLLADPRYPDLMLKVVSKDKDLEQLLCDRLCMFDIHTDTTIDCAALKANKGITPEQVVDVLALTGDTVDNVPGVYGVGPKTAAKLIQQYGSLAGVLAHLDQLSPKQRENFEKAKDMLPLSRQLVQLKKDVEVSFELEDGRVRGVNGAAIRRMFQELGFRRHQSELEKLLDRLDSASSAGGTTASAAPAAAAASVAKSSQAAKPEENFAQSLFGFAEEAASAQAAVEPAAEPTGTVSLAEFRMPEPDANLTTAADCRYSAITTQKQLDELVTTLAGQKLVSLDTETIGLGHRAKICGLSLSWEEGQGVYLPICSPESESHLSCAQIIAALGPLFENPALPKCGHNLKYDLLVLRQCGVQVRGVVFDSLIAAFLLNLPAAGLDDLSLALNRHRNIPISSLIGDRPNRGSDQRQRTMDQVPVAQIAIYASEDADMALRLCHTLEARLAEVGMAELSQRIEMPLVEVLAEMEHHGIRVEPSVLLQQKEALSGRISALRQEIEKNLGVPCNIDSPKQLADVLFNQLGLPIIKKTKTGASTDVEVLERLAEHDSLSPEQARIPRLIVEYRQLSKLVNTYLDNLCESIHKDTGRIHATFHQSGAATGRLSSSGPNLQNIPIRTEVGRLIRKAFVAEPGQQLISADYSQIELRILAHLSQDQALLQAFARDQDIHAAVAAQVFSVAPDQVTTEQRAYAKVINFGIIYGVTAQGLARRIDNLDLAGARQLIADYRRRFPGIDQFLAQCIAQAQEHGYVTTMFGRRRPISQIRSGNANIRSLGERLAINTVVQGSAADLIKLAMVNLHQRIGRENLPLKLLLQIHDELVAEAPTEHAQAMAQVVRQEMEQALSLRVPLKVEVATGSDWFTAK